MIHMGIFDSVSNAANRGVAAAGRTSRSVKLKMQADDLLRQRKDYAAQLGASLYEKTKDMPEMREGRESLYIAIEGIDRQRQEIAAELEAIEAAARESEQASQMYKCGKCGNAVSSADLYCSGCGRPVADIKAEAAAIAAAQPTPAQGVPGAQLACPKCGAPVAVNDAFCMSCGAELARMAQPVAEGPGDRLAEPVVAVGLAAQEVAGPGTADSSAVEQVAIGPGDAGVVVAGSGDAGLGAAGLATGLAAAYDETVWPQQAEPSPSPLCCAQCGAPVSPKDAFCGNCGRKV